MQKGVVFDGWIEKEIAWGPTYRWERLENVLSNKKEQAPSFTDRILTFSLPGLELGNSFDKFAQLSYCSAPNIFGSDHRPIFAVFTAVPLKSSNSLAKIGNLSLSLLFCCLLLFFMPIADARCHLVFISFAIDFVLLRIFTAESGNDEKSIINRAALTLPPSIVFAELSLELTPNSHLEQLPDKSSVGLKGAEITFTASFMAKDEVGKSSLQTNLDQCSWTDDVVITPFINDKEELATK